MLQTRFQWSGAATSPRDRYTEIDDQIALPMMNMPRVTKSMSCSPLPAMVLGVEQIIMMEDGQVGTVARGLFASAG